MASFFENPTIAPLAKQAQQLVHSNRLKRGAGRGFWILFRTALLFGLSFVLLYPLIYTLSIAFRQPIDMANPAVIWIPRHLTLENIKDAYRFMDYTQSFWNTIKLGLVSSVLQVISCSLVGYGFARFRFPLKGLAFGLVIFTIIIPPQVVYVPTYMMFKDFDIFGILGLAGQITGQKLTFTLLNSPLTLYLPALFGVGIRSGLFIYIFRQFYRNLPRELEDAAYIDGCGHMQTFLRIIVPNAKAAFLTVILFSIVWYWNDYYYVSMYFSNMKTVSTALAGLVDAFTTDVNFESLRTDPYMITTRLQAGCLLVITPMLIMYIALQKYFTEGIERTGLVG